MRPLWGGGFGLKNGMIGAPGPRNETDGELSSSVSRRYVNEKAFDRDP